MIKILLVDTNRAAYPIYTALCKPEHEVWVVGNNPSDTLAKLATNYEQLDYSDADKLAAFVKEKDFDYLVPGCTDLSYEMCAKINNRQFFGIDTSANTAVINKKSEFRKAAVKLSLPVPRLLPLEKVSDVNSVIVKPVDSFSGRGMTVIKNPVMSKVENALDYARKFSKTGKAIIEEFVSGQLFSHSAFIREGKVVTDFIVQEDCISNSYAVDTSRVVFDFSIGMLDLLRTDVCRLATSLNLLDGLVHTQFIVSGNKYWIIEITRRCPGDLYSLLIEFSTGYSYAANYAAPFVGGTVCLPDADIHPERIIRHTASPKDDKSLWGFGFSCPVDIKLFVPLAISGTVLGAGPNGRAGIFFFRTSSKQKQDVLYQKILTQDLYSFS